MQQVMLRHLEKPQWARPHAANTETCCAPQMALCPRTGWEA